MVVKEYFKQFNYVLFFSILKKVCFLIIEIIYSSNPIDFVLLLVEGCGIVLEILDQGARFRTLVEGFGLAFVNYAAATVHGSHRFGSGIGVVETGTGIIWRRVDDRPGRS